MKRVLTAVILIPVVVLALFRAPLWLFTLLVLGVALLAAKEYLDIAAATGFRPFRGLSYGLLLLLFFVVAISVANNGKIERTNNNLSGAAWIAAFSAMSVLLLCPYILMVFSMRRELLSQSLADASVSFLLLPYVGVPLVLLLPLRAIEYGSLYLMFTMLLVWTGDIAALYAGRAFGRNKLAPRVSPGKTWEGTIASLIGAVIVAVVLLHYVNPIAGALTRVHLIPDPALGGDLYPIPGISGVMPILGVAPIWLTIVFGLSVNVATQFGDLVESAMKRGAGLKDSGTLLPGHGGVLDRIDALLFALPVAFFFYIPIGRYFQLHGIR